MAGVYTENQPDFTWLMPYEEKQFTQYFMPYRDLGIVKQASKDFIFNIEEPIHSPSRGEGSEVTFQVLATSKQEARIVLRHDDGTVYYNKVLTLSPETVLTETVTVGDAKLDELTFSILSPLSSLLSPFLTWHAEPDDIRPIPDAAEAALPPSETKTNDQLYLTGLHLEQYRHATWSALDYYEEALRRDPRDVRCLNQLGLWYLRRGHFDRAEEYLRRAVRIWQKRNPNPYDGEPIFNLALALKYKRMLSTPLPTREGQGGESSYSLFWKATWNKAWADAAYFEAACISVAEGRFTDALDELDRCLISNSHNHKARALRATVLRKLGRTSEALQWIDASLRIDRFNYGCRYEQYLLTGDEQLLQTLKSLLRGSSQNYDEVALDYAAANLCEEAGAIWQMAIDEGADTPMTYYYMHDYERAAKADITYCFPNRLEDIVALEAAKRHSPHDGHAPYLLGCLYYDKRQYDLAIENWELSARLDPQFPTVWRNLALARFNKQDRQQEALELMERAFRLDESDARIFMELDQLYKRLQHPHAERIARYEAHPDLVAQRDDLVLEKITLLNQLGRHEEAMTLLDSHQFHPWEGGEGKVPAQYQIARVELAKRMLNDHNPTLSLQPTPNPSRGEGSLVTSAKEYVNSKANQAPLPSGGAGGGFWDGAVTLLTECLTYPPHLGEGKLYGAQENDFYYFLGLAHEQLGDPEKARQCWEKATVGSQEPAAAIYYNDAKPDKIFYQGMALRKLGRDDEANGRFWKLVNYGQQHLFERQTMDYFAVSLPDLLIWEDSLDTKNRIHCLYMLALGHYGLGHIDKALHYLAEVEALDINHQGIQALRTLIG